MKDLRDRRNAAALRGMRWMRKFLSSERHRALIEIGDDGACIFFEIWYTSSSSVLRSVARSFAEASARGERTSWTPGVVGEV